MKYFDWDQDKNEWLIKNRGISFELIMSLIESGAIIAIEDNHPPYAHQKVLMIKVEDYIYEVPYVIDGEKIFFKTIYPSRQSTDKYLPE